MTWLQSSNREKLENRTLQENRGDGFKVYRVMPRLEIVVTQGNARLSYSFIFGQVDEWNTEGRLFSFSVS